MFDLSALPYAHRGLWGGSIPENSLGAFQAAAREGVGCELDVRVTGDGKLVVFHDPTLQRMCGQPGRVDQLPFSVLRSARLPDGSAIPTLEEALEAMQGLPALVELKTDQPGRGGDGDHRGVAPLAEILAASGAQAAVMSFDEQAVAMLAAALRDRPVGQLIEPDQPGREGRAAAKALRASKSAASYLAPHVSAVADIPALLEDIPRVAWTVRNPEQLAICRLNGATPIFEGLSPALAKSAANTI